MMLQLEIWIVVFFTPVCFTLQIKLTWKSSPTSVLMVEGYFFIKSKSIKFQKVQPKRNWFMPESFVDPGLWITPLNWRNGYAS